MTPKKPSPSSPRSSSGSKRPGGPVDVRGFEVQLSCPHCGGPFVATDATVSHMCEHCRSLLIVEAPTREEVFVEPAQVTEPLLQIRRINGEAARQAEVGEVVPVSRELQDVGALRAEVLAERRTSATGVALNHGERFAGFWSHGDAKRPPRAWREGRG